MREEVVRTGVDELLDLLANNPNTKLALTEVASQLKLDAEVVQTWIDFLVEENIVGIEYKFTTPYIYLNKVIKKNEEQSEQQYNIQYFKRKFWEKAKSNNIPEPKIEMLWRNHITQALELQKKYFFFEVQKRKILNPEKLWQEYKELIQYA